MFFLFILVIFTILIIAIHTSKIGIDIKNLIIDTDAEEKINEDGKIYVYLLLFNKIKLFRKNVRNIPMKDVKFETSDFDIKIFKNKDIKINYLELIQNINIDIKNIDLNVNIGTEDAGITAILVGILAGILGIIIKKPKYQILPIYANRNLLKINLNGIFTIYLMHYIYKFIKDNIKERFMDKPLNKNLNFKVR
ncbi:unknown [Clostridium sp. CAG:269]|nr:unknown [Clostridium sp. CAG:269]